MKAHNERMKALLEANGIKCRVKLIEKGSMKGQWRFYQPDVMWYGNTDLQNKFIELGFKDKYRSAWTGGHGITDHTGNGGSFHVFLIYTKTI